MYMRTHFPPRRWSRDSFHDSSSNVSNMVDALRAGQVSRCCHPSGGHSFRVARLGSEFSVSEYILAIAKYP